MEINNKSPNESQQSPVVNQTIRPQNNKLLKSIPYVITAVVLMVVGAFGFWLYQGAVLKQNESKVKEASEKLTILPSAEIPTSPPTSEPTQSEKSTAQDGFITYEHPRLGYTLKYPENWNGRTEKIPEGINQKYEDFIAESPDYKLSTEGYPILEKGAMMFIRAEETTDTDIDAYFDSTPLAREIAKNKKYFTLNSNKGIQYDYSYEGWNATDTVTISNGVVYLIKLRYVDDSEKQLFWKNYIDLLNSLKTK